MTTVPLTRQIFPTPIDRLRERLELRILRFRARLRILLRTTRSSKLRVKIVVVAFLIYSASPLDFIPDFIPVIGVLDELLILMLVVWYVKRHDPAVARAITHLFR